VLYLCNQLAWELPPPPQPVQSETTVTATRLQPPRGNLKKRASASSSDEEGSKLPQPPRRVGERYVITHTWPTSPLTTASTSHVWLFDGAEGGKWLKQLQKELGIQVPRSVPPSVPGSGYNTRSSTPAIRDSPTKDVVDGRREAKKQRLV